MNAQFRASERKAICWCVTIVALLLTTSSIALGLIIYASRRACSIVDFEKDRGFWHRRGTPVGVPVKLRFFGVDDEREGSLETCRILSLRLNQIFAHSNLQEREAILAAFALLIRQGSETRLSSFLERLLTEKRLPRFAFRKVTA
jgi:hypothetical protein